MLVEKFIKTITLPWHCLCAKIGDVITVILVIITLCGATMCVMMGIDAVMEEKLGCDGIAVWQFMPDKVRKELTNLDKEHGNVVYLGITYQKGQAIQVAKEQTEKFNRDVLAELSNVQHGFKSKPDSNFDTLVDLYYVSNAKGRMLFFVPRGSKVQAGAEKIELDY